MTNAWDRIQQGAYEALEWAENMISALPDMDQLGSLMAQGAGKEVTNALN
jgi:hypothetical protein